MGRVPDLGAVVPRDGARPRGRGRCAHPLGQRDLTPSVAVGVAVDLQEFPDRRVEVVAVRPGDRGVPVGVVVAEVAEQIAVQVPLERVRQAGAAVQGVVHIVPVGVEVTEVPRAVPVEVVLRGIEGPGAEIEAVHDVVPVGILIAEIPDPVFVEVHLERIGEFRAEVDRVIHAVAVAIGVAEVADEVRVEVALDRVREEGAEVGVVGDEIVVVVVLTEVPGAVAVAVHRVGAGIHRDRVDARRAAAVGDGEDAVEQGGPGEADVIEVEVVVPGDQRGRGVQDPHRVGPGRTVT